MSPAVGRAQLLRLHAERLRRAGRATGQRCQAARQGRAQQVRRRLLVPFDLSVEPLADEAKELAR